MSGWVIRNVVCFYLAVLCICLALLCMCFGTLCSINTLISDANTLHIQTGICHENQSLLLLLLFYTLELKMLLIFKFFCQSWRKMCAPWLNRQNLQKQFNLHIRKIYFFFGGGDANKEYECCLNIVITFHNLLKPYSITFSHVNVKLYCLHFCLNKPNMESIKRFGILVFLPIQHHALLSQTTVQQFKAQCDKLKKELRVLHKQ